MRHFVWYIYSILEAKSVSFETKDLLISFRNAAGNPFQVIVNFSHSTKVLPRFAGRPRQKPCPWHQQSRATADLQVRSKYAHATFGLGIRPQEDPNP